MEHKNHHKLNKRKCLACGYEIDAATEAYDRAPKPREGDFSMCLNCGAIAVFDNNLQFRKPTASEKQVAASNSAVQRALQVREFVVTKDLRKKKVEVQ